MEDYSRRSGKREPWRPPARHRGHNRVLLSTEPHALTLTIEA